MNVSDFTYVDDLVEGIYRLAQCVPIRPVDGEPLDDTVSPVAPYRIVNIAGGSPVRLMAFIDEIEKSVGRKAICNYMPMQKGDVPRTFANADVLERLTGYRPSTPVADGVRSFVAWYREYHKT